jgi:tripartite-type tricarboxylate transporter receptor subunit TctC
MPTARLRPLLLALLLPLAAAAQDNPPLRIIVPTPPGGTNDAVARALQQPLQKLLARTVIVEYKAGAAGSLGSAFVARAKPDGNTLLLNNNAVLINPLVSGGNGYEMKELSPVAVAATSPLVLIANGDLPVQDTRELVAYAARQAQPLPYASSGGVGSIGHLAMESFARAAGIRLLHVPYTGGAPAQTAVLSGEVKMVLTTLTASHKAQVAAGKLRLLGIAAAAPSPLMPGVRPIPEAVPGFEADAWFGLLAPAQTPPATVQRIAAAVKQALEQPEAREQLQSAGVQPTYIAPEAFARRIEQESLRWGEVVREQKIRKE